MKNINDVCVIVQARLGSERIPKKMIKPFAGSTLLDILFSKLTKSKVIPKDNIHFSVYDKELEDIGIKHGINIWNRSEESAKSEGDPLYEIFDWYDKLPYKYFIIVSSCNPLLRVETIDSFFTKFIESDKEGCLGVFEKKTYYWDKNGKAITDWKGSTRMNNKFIDPIFEAGHCLYASRMDIVGDNYYMDTKSPIEPELFVMNELETFDIDYQWQFEIGEVMYGKDNILYTE